MKTDNMPVIGAVPIRQLSSKVVPIQKDSKILETPGLRSVYFKRSNSDDATALQELSESFEKFVANKNNLVIISVSNFVVVDQPKRGKHPVKTFYCHLVYKE
jgi:hypothetical protein